MTRADFYVGRGLEAEWLGSVAGDGYPEGIVPRSAVRHKRAPWPDGEHLFDATTEDEFRERLARYFLYRDDVTLPRQGWPWPWETSHRTDYAYAFDGGTVYASNFGEPWFVAGEEPEEPEAPVFPDMSAIKAVTYGPRSGLLVLGAATEGGTDG